MRNLPPLAAVRVFEAASRHLNFTHAAEELGLTQAAVSYQIKLLEDRLATRLFVRQGRGLILTEIGRRIAPQVNAAFDLLGEAFGSVASETAAVLTISAPTSFATNWLAGRLGAFQLSQAGLAVKLQVEDRLVDFARDTADVAIRAVADPGPTLRHHFLMRMAYAPYASPALLARYPVPAEPADLLGLPRLGDDDEWWETWFQAVGLTTVNPAPSGGIRFESQVLIGNAALNGHGAAMLTPAYWQPQIDSGQLVRLLPQIPAPCWSSSFWVVYPEAKRNLPKVRAFRDWILAEAKAAMGDDPDAVLVPPPTIAAVA